MSDTRVYSFGNEGASASNLLASYLPLLQQKGVDPSILYAMGNGNGLGNFGFNEIIALIVIAAIFGGNGNGIFGGGNDNNTEREMLMSAIQRNGTDLSQLAQSLHCSVGQLDSAINNVATQICNLAAQTGQSSLSIINAVQAGNAGLASQLASCCCDVRQAIATSDYNTERGFCNTNQILARGFSDLGYATAQQTCSIEKAIGDSTAQILAGQAAIEKRELQREIATLQDERQTYKLGNMIGSATAPILAEIESIKCKLPKTETIVAQPQYIPVNYGVNYSLTPYNACGFGFGGYGAGNWTGWTGGSLWG